MASALDLISLSDLSTYKSKPGSSRDQALALFITAASRAIENHLGRRIRYRGPVEVEGAANIVASRPFSGEIIPSGSITQPNAAGRTLIVTVTDVDLGVSGGLVTVTGTVGGQAGQTEVFNLSRGLRHHGLKFFSAISSIVVSDPSGAGTGDLLKIGSSVGYTEEHTRDPNDPCVCQPIEWPVRNILEVNEDAARAFGVTTKLTSGTDYFLVRADTQRQERSSLLRLSSALPTAWAGGWRANKLVLASGYSAGEVPADLSDVARRLVTLLDDEVAKGRLGMSSVSDAIGNYTRFAAAGLTPEMRRQLEPYRRRSFGFETGERDWDLEEAA